jgi:hypothetical protein
VRVVTIAEAEPYQKVLPIQKWLWRKITEHRVFKYVGQPIGQEWAEELDLNGGPVAQLLRDGGRFVSGDFSAATDNLDPALTEYAWECICECASVEDEHGVLPLSLSPFAGLVKKALTGHCLDYGGPVIMDQTWGQLMGSPVSFPLLNIINAATTAVSMFILRIPTVCCRWIPSSIPVTTGMRDGSHFCGVRRGNSSRDIRCERMATICFSSVLRTPYMGGRMRFGNRLLVSRAFSPLSARTTSRTYLL